MTQHIPLFHSLLRPCVLQILRAQGYHAARPSVVDALTDLAARYLVILCESAAHHTAHNSTELTGLEPSLVDIRLALEDCSAIFGKDASPDDTRGVDEFVDWVTGPRNREIRRIALDGEDEATDYLEMLKKKHSKTGEDSKYSSTVLGRGNVDHHDLPGSSDIVVEGGDVPSIALWQEKRIESRQQPPPPTPPPDNKNEDEGDEEMEDAGRGSRSPSSGLSSLGDRSIDEEMELEFGIGGEKEAESFQAAGPA